MEALQFNAAQKKLGLAKIPKPVLANENDVLIKVAYAGICGTDLHIIQGEFRCRQDSSVTLGHEFSGTVTEIGRLVNNVKVGDKVAVDPNLGCGVCKVCRKGDPHFCKDGGLDNTIGIFRNGGWAQYVVAPDAQVFKLPEGVTLEQGALVEPLSCISHGWDRMNPVTLGQDILITGAGIIGNLFITILHLQGHRKITISEPNQSRLCMLKDSFKELTFADPATLAKQQKEDPDFGFDLVIDCSGNNRAIEQGFGLLNKGGRLCIFGVAPPEARISLSPYDIFNKELTIMGVIINPFSFPTALDMAVALGQKYLNYKLLGVRMYGLSDYKEALEELKKGSISKAVFKMS